MRATPPVLLTIWRRPDAARRVLDAIGVARPKQLFIASDGPRDGGGEAMLIAETRRIVEEGVDWDCGVATLHRDRNLGCRLAMAGAIDWFFDHVAQGIILEDDCLPHPDFFPYCAELLDRYRDDERVMHIGGDNATSIAWAGEDSYRFVRWPQVWGWATWRRAWRNYDHDLSAWTAATAGLRGRRIIPDAVDREVWMPRLARLREKGVPDTWDYQWIASNVRLGGLSIHPRTNLITNIGFGPDATHTRDPRSPRAGRPTGPILPLTHPGEVSVDATVDRKLLEDAWKRSKFARRLIERRSLRGRVRWTAGLVRRSLGYSRRWVRAIAAGTDVKP